MLNVTEQELRDVCRLGYRAKYLPAFANYFGKHDPDSLMELNRESIMAELQSIKGVGPYTAGVIASHALRDTEAVGLDTWNRKIVAKALLGLDDADPDVVLAKLKKLFPGYPGTALMYLVENEYINSPVVSLIYDKSGEPN
jgi:3-methyladenine DNA glycosylase/8-oxoguanine DNA glycosylase